MKLKSDLQQALGLKQDEISVNQLTRHIIIKVRKAHVLELTCRITAKVNVGLAKA